MLKRFVIAICILALAICSVYAYDNTPPDNPLYFGTCFLTVDTDELGEVTIYFPLSYQSGYFSWDGSTLRNVSNSSITGYYRSDTDYYVRWSAFSEATYRYPNGNYWTTDDLTITDIISTNVQLIEQMEYNVTTDSILTYIIIFLLGVIVLILFMKKF